MSEETFREIEIFPARSGAGRLDALKHRIQRDYRDFGEAYFDAEDGVYQGYAYDGRYADAARKLVQTYDLKPGSRVLELGCAKGYVLVELQKLGMDVKGIDASKYAVENCHPDLTGRVECRRLGASLALPDQSYELVFAKELLPHLHPWHALQLAAHISRIGRAAYLEIQVAESEESARLMKQWDPTHQTCKGRDWWKRQLQSAGYQGAVHFKELFPCT
jgi:SAM-dependent methyltransferase